MWLLSPGSAGDGQVPSPQRFVFAFSSFTNSSCITRLCALGTSHTTIQEPALELNPITLLLVGKALSLKTCAPGPLVCPSVFATPKVESGIVWEARDKSSNRASATLPEQVENISAPSKYSLQAPFCRFCAPIAPPG